MDFIFVYVFIVMEQISQILLQFN